MISNFIIFAIMVIIFALTCGVTYLGYLFLDRMGLIKTYNEDDLLDADWEKES